MIENVNLTHFIINQNVPYPVRRVREGVRCRKPFAIVLVEGLCGTIHISLIASLISFEWIKLRVHLEITLNLLHHNSSHEHAYD